jgi:hypothetical protein
MSNQKVSAVKSSGKQSQNNQNEVTNQLQAQIVELTERTNLFENFARQADRMFERMERMERNQMMLDQNQQLFIQSLRDGNFSALNRDRNEDSMSVKELETDTKPVDLVAVGDDEADYSVEDHFRSMTGKGVISYAAYGSGKNDVKTVAESKRKDIPNNNKKNRKIEGKVPTSVHRKPTTIPDGGDDDNDGSDSLSSDNDESSKEEDLKDSDSPGNNRRLSYIQQLTKAAEQRDNITNVAVTRVQPSFNHIKLERLTIKEVFNFFETVFEYELDNNLSIRLVHQLSKEVRKELLAHHPNVSLKAFYGMSNTKLIQFIQVHIRPNTTIGFQEILIHYVEFRYESKYAPTPIAFQKFYTSLLVYKDEFIKYYDVISENNKDCIPPTNDREGGLIKIFTDKIPFQYGRRIVQILKSRSYKNIYVFLKKFYVEVERDYGDYKNARSFNEHFGGTEYKAKLSRPAFDNNNSYRTAKGNNSYNDRNNKDRKSYHKLHALTDNSFIPDIDMELVDYEAGDYFENSNNNSNTKTTSIEEEDHDQDYRPSSLTIDDDTEDKEARNYISNKVSNLGDNLEVNIDREDDSDNNLMHALFNLNVKKDGNNNSQVPRGCFQKLFGKPCKAGEKCPYSHDWKDLNKAYEYYKSLLDNSKYKSNASTTMSILRRPPGQV